MPRRKKTSDDEKTARTRLSMRSSRKTELVARARARITSVKKHPDYPNRPKIQGSIKKFGAAADALENTNTALSVLRAREKSLLSTQAIQVAALKRAARSVIADIDEETDGSAAGIAAWGFEVVQAAAPIVDAPPPPTNLRVTYDREHRQILRWKAVIGHMGYLIQFGDSATDKWDEPIHVTRASYYPTGIAIGQSVSARVAVQRSSGFSAFCDALTFVVR